MPVIPATRETEAGKSLELRRPRLQDWIPLYCLGWSQTLGLKQPSCFGLPKYWDYRRATVPDQPQDSLLGRYDLTLSPRLECRGTIIVQCSTEHLGRPKTLVILPPSASQIALWEAEVGRSLEVRSSRPPWPTAENPSLLKNTKIISATWEAETGEFLEPEMEVARQGFTMLQAGLEPLTSSDPYTSASQSTGIIGMNQHLLCVIFPKAPAEGERATAGLQPWSPEVAQPVQLQRNWAECLLVLLHSLLDSFQHLIEQGL
ncbi:hypothetical protein AAY473_039211 [Plecturocebus cupreus]